MLFYCNSTFLSVKSDSGKSSPCTKQPFRHASRATFPYTGTATVAAVTISARSFGRKPAPLCKGSCQLRWLRDCRKLTLTTLPSRFACHLPLHRDGYCRRSYGDMHRFRRIFRRFEKLSVLSTFLCTGILLLVISALRHIQTKICLTNLYCAHYTTKSPFCQEFFEQKFYYFAKSTSRRRLFVNLYTKIAYTASKHFLYLYTKSSHAF